MLRHVLADVTSPSKPFRSNRCAAFTSPSYCGNSTVSAAGKGGGGGLCTCVPLLQYALLNHQKLDGGNGESHDESCENNSNQHSGIFFF